MRNSSKINLNEARNSQLREVLLTVDECCLQLGIDFYILGALARDAWFTKEGIATRATKDVDFAASFIGMVAAFAGAPTTAQLQASQQVVSETLPLPRIEVSAADTIEPEALYIREERVQRAASGRSRWRVSIKPSVPKRWRR